jgi:hypothetical protein
MEDPADRAGCQQEGCGQEEASLARVRRFGVTGRDSVCDWTNVWPAASIPSTPCLHSIIVISSRAIFVDRKNRDTHAHAASEDGHARRAPHWRRTSIAASP